MDVVLLFNIEPKWII